MHSLTPSGRITGKDQFGPKLELLKGIRRWRIVRSRFPPPISLKYFKICNLERTAVRFPRKNWRLLLMKDTREDSPRFETWPRTELFSDRGMPCVLRKGGMSGERRIEPPCKQS